MTSQQERMRRVFRDKDELTAHVLEGTAFKINWTNKEAALALGFPVDFWERLEGKTLRADVEETGITLRITNQALEAQELGFRVWQDLVTGFSEGRKDNVAWRETYKLLCMILYAGYSQVEIKDYLELVEQDKAVNPTALEIGSFKEIHDFVLAGGELGQIDMDLQGLHAAAAAIYYLVLPPCIKE